MSRRGEGEWEGTRLAVRSRPEKTRRAQRKSSLLKVDGSGGTRAAGRRAQMAGNTHQCQSVKGDWSVCETDPPYLPPPLPVWGGSYVTGVLTWPLSFMSQSGDDRFQRWSPLPAAELFTCYSISAAYCTSQRFRRGLSLQRGLAASCHWLTAEAFKVGCEIRPRGPGCSAASNPLLYKPRLMQ